MLRRHTNRIAGAILCDTRAGADSDAVRNNRLKLAEDVLQNGPQPVADAMVPKLLSKYTQEHNPDLVKEVESMITSTSPAVIAAASRGMAQRDDNTDLLQKIEVPTLLVVGEEDVPSPPEEMQKMADAIPQGRLVRLSNAGHLTPMEQPEAFNASVKMFLRDLPR
jgi:pimeloyl-ACP methyl ester carboxylesterase